MSEFEDAMLLVNAGPTLEDFSPEAREEMVIEQAAASLRLAGFETDAVILRNILAKGTLSSMTRAQVLGSVARQVASSQRLAGEQTTLDEVLKILASREE